MKKILIVIIIILAAGLIFRDHVSLFFKQASAQKSQGGKKKNKDVAGDAVSDVKIVSQWELPSELLEVSGIAHLDEDRFACVQDEKGVIFIFNKATGKIERELPFADPGDFEGLTLAGATAYAVRADGMIYEIDLTNKKTTSYNTYLTVSNNVEGLCFDAANNRLLLAGKYADENFPGYKCIYAFDLKSKQLLKEPAFKINLDDPLLGSSGKKKSKALMPSSIGIHPITADIFITDGPSSRLLQIDKNGNVKKMYSLGKNFYQPEGLSFSPAGKLYISNEGKKNAGNIIEVEL